MSTQDREDNTTYKVVVNHEDHYSIWPTDRENPDGATPPGRDRQQECLDHIKSVWADIRPLSLMKRTAQEASSTLCRASKG